MTEPVKVNQPKEQEQAKKGFFVKLFDGLKDIKLLDKLKEIYNSIKNGEDVDRVYIEGEDKIVASDRTDMNL